MFFGSRFGVVHWDHPHFRIGGGGGNRTGVHSLPGRVLLSSRSKSSKRFISEPILCRAASVVSHRCLRTASLPMLAVIDADAVSYPSFFAISVTLGCV